MTKGIMIGAAINAVYISYMHTGGCVTDDILSAGVVGTAMGILANVSFLALEQMTWFNTRK